MFLCLIVQKGIKQEPQKHVTITSGLFGYNSFFNLDLMHIAFFVLKNKSTMYLLRKHCFCAVRSYHYYYTYIVVDGDDGLNQSWC